MKFSGKALRLAMLLAASWVLVACSQPGNSGAETQRPNDSIAISVSLAGDSFSTQALQPQGAPYDDDGIAVEDVQVSVTDADNNPISFRLENGTYVADSGGTIDSLTLSPGNPSVGVVLFDLGNPYTFEALAENNAGNTIAYAEVTQAVSTNGTVRLELQSVLGAADLSLRLPTNYVLPDQVVDLMLNVTANGAPTLKVPLADFDVTYSVTPADSATIDVESGRGVRITASAACTNEITITATVTGLVENGSDITSDQVTASFDLPCATAISGGGILVDLDNPTVSFNLNGSEVSGNVSDNIGIKEVQVWDGPALLASTNVGTTSHDITINGSGAFSVNLGTSMSDSVSVVAIDTSGNQTDTADTVNPNFLFVDAQATAGGDGSRSNPFNSVTAAVDAVNNGGTVYMFDGTYHYNASVVGEPKITAGRDGITLRGESQSGTILIPNTGDNMTNYGLLVNNADDVTFENFTIDTSSLGTGAGSTLRIVAVQVAERFTMRNVSIQGNQLSLGYSGVNFTSVKDAVLDNVTVDGIGGNALSLKATENLVLRDVSISNSDVGIHILTARPTEPNYFDSRNYIDLGITSTDNGYGLIITHEAWDVTDVTLSGYTHAVRKNSTGSCDDNSAAAGFVYYYFDDTASADSYVNGECGGSGHVFDLTGSPDLADIIGSGY